MGQPAGLSSGTSSEAAVAAGKHVFMEKPLATDERPAPRILAANVEAQPQRA